MRRSRYLKTSQQLFNRRLNRAWPDAGAAIAEAIRLIDEHDELVALRAKIQVGLDQAARGEVVPFNEETRQRISVRVMPSMSEAIR